MRVSERRRPVWTFACATTIAVTFFVATAVGGSAAAQTPTGESVSTPVIERALESRAKGDPSAAVVVFEVADFQCPYCAQFAGTVGKELDRKYVQTGRVQWVFVNLPLHTHRLAWVAAEAALCAGAAGDRFWPMHERIFAEQRRWAAMDNPGPFFARVARELGVAEADYAACVAEDRVAPLILQDFGSAISAGITGTPTFLVMRDDEVIERVVGLQSVEDWSRLLDRALARR
jgi:protein-disulfide isomerase